MLLKQIKLSGFKSFVDDTTIHVDGSLVGIVGPNGCGKSNVIDAVRWVLGESSAKQLRGDSMQDVIFNGSVKRKPVSRASVELIFDNNKQMLTGLWNSYSEISIKRVLSRSGESTYYINNQVVRRKDINELFLGTGVGTKGYAIIEQGMISRIIESSPENLRSYLEEASGVSKYREKRKETRTRLENTNDNLTRLNDIYDGLAKNLAKLEEQAIVAKQYYTMDKQRAELKLTHLATRKYESEEIASNMNQQITKIDSDLQQITAEQNVLQEELSYKQDNKAQLDVYVQSMVDALNENRTVLARFEERYKHYNDLLRRFEVQSVELTAKENNLSLEIDNLQLELEEINLTIEELNLIKAEIEIEAEASEDDFIDAKEELIKATNDLENCTASINKLNHEIDLLRNSLEHKQTTSDSLINKQHKLQTEFLELVVADDFELKKAELAILEDAYIALDNDGSQCKDELDKLIHKKQLALDELNNLEQVLSAKTAKHDTLNELLNNLNLAEDDITQLFATNNVSSLWQQIKVESGYEKIVEAVLKDYLYSYLLDNHTQIKQVPQKALSILLADDIVIKAKANTIADYVEILNESYSFIYNILNKFILLDEFDYTQKNIKQVNYAGHIYADNQIVFAGAVAENNSLEYKNQVDKLVAEIAEIINKKEAVQNKLNSLVSELGVLQSRANLIQSKLETNKLNKHALELDITKQEQIQNQAIANNQRIEAELTNIEQELLVLEQQIEDSEIAIEDKQASIERQQKKLDNFIEEKTLAQNNIDLFNAHEQEKKQRLTAIDFDLQVNSQQIKHHNGLIEEKRRQIVECKQTLSNLEAEKLNFNGTHQGEEVVKLQQEISNIALRIGERQGEQEKLISEIIALKNKLSALNTNYQSGTAQINLLRLKEQEHIVLLGTFKETLAEFNVTEEELTNLAKQNTLSLAKLAGLIKDLDDNIAALGLVNLKALEDLDNAKNQEIELASQILDLQNSVAQLEDAILQIDEQTRSLMSNTFKHLDSALQDYFVLLFGGGSAKLQLTEGDILVAGLQILAQPPGKKNSTIHLLSGGEKALCAMSFVFALFSLNPAPFCLLDEVDAPLDDANTGRFCKLVKELSNKTQFVYISHNRLAMEIADQLVGVTMQEKGVSKVVSVSLVEAVKYNEVK